MTSVACVPRAAPIGSTPSSVGGAVCAEAAAAAADIARKPRMRPNVCRTVLLPSSARNHELLARLATCHRVQSKRAVIPAGGEPAAVGAQRETHHPIRLRLEAVR